MKQNTTTTKQTIKETKTAITIKGIRETYENISLRRICEETGLCYQYVLKASKKPIAGVAYDAAAFNYGEVDKIVDRKQVNLSAFDWETISKSIQVTAPVSKQEDFTVGVRFTLREPKVREVTPTYTVVFITDTHVVFLPDEDTQPRCMNWDTFAHQSPRIAAKKAESEKPEEK